MLPDPAQRASWLAFPVVAAVLVVVGIRRHATPNPWPAYAVATVCALLAGADVLLTVGGPLAELGGLVLLLAYAVLVAASLGIARIRVPDGDRSGAIDSLIVLVATAALLWDFITAPVLLTGPGADLAVVAVVYPLASAATAAAALRVLFADATQNRSAWLLLAAGVVTLTGNVLWLVTGGGDWHLGARLLWACGFVLLALAELDPDIVPLHRPVEREHTALSRGRLVVLGAALLAVPLALLRSWEGAREGPPVAIGAAATCVVLVLLRLGMLLAERERAWEELARRASRETAIGRVTEAALRGATLDDVLARTHEELDRVLGPDVVRLELGGDGGGPRTAVALHVMDPTASAADMGLAQALANVVEAGARQRAAEAAVRRQATHDSLTDLPNRRAFTDALGHALAEDRHPVVVFLDLDDFKAVNDTHGHAAGDTVLVTTARRITEQVRSGDLVARLAGDEFVVLAEAHDDMVAAELGRRLLAAVAAPVVLDAPGRRVAVSASIGIARARPGESAAALLSRADGAMYRVKARGRSGVELEPATTGGAPGA